MAATLAPTTIDRSDFRTVLAGGTRLGLFTAFAVVLYLIVSKRVPAGSAQSVLETLVVLGAGAVATFLPGRWCAARSVEGIAGAAGVGLWGALVFSAVDIIVLRPVKAYPWTWDAVGGGSTWWYLPVWWMLGTFLAWMGGIVTAASGGATLARRALPAVAGTIIVTALRRPPRVPVALPVVLGAALTLLPPAPA